MSSAAGTRLGHFEVVELLGAGGMGEVYRARDTELGREVAIKLLPESFAENAERLARFDREAHLLASLNHPNIATLFGFEREGSTRFLIMELVEGETLAGRIGLGRVPVDEALPLFLQIAEGLEAAHEKGVIHRDLKPANIKVTEDGHVKLLDFGLAKAMEPDPEPEVLSHSPTLTAPATRRGEILGTAAYMSPEQAMGRPVDKRADIWAFGCCLYEALSGGRAFRGEAVSDTLASVLKEEPEWGRLPGGIPLRVRELLARCLEKQARERLRDIGDARIELRQALSTPVGSEGEAVPGLPQRGRGRVALLVTLLAVSAAVVAALVTGFLISRRPPPEREPARTIRLDLRLPPTDRLSLGRQRALALSPDGRTVVYAARRGSQEMLFRRALDQGEAMPIEGTERAGAPFFSADGRWLGFLTNPDWQLMKVALAGGRPELLVSLSDSGLETPAIFGVDWTLDDELVIGSPNSGIWRIPLAGGKAQALTTLDSERGESAHLRPRLLPGGEALLYTVETGGSQVGQEVVIERLATGERRVLAEGESLGYSPSGHVLLQRAGTVWTVPIDAEQLTATGRAVPVLEASRPNQLALSGNGTLVYAGGGGARHRLIWVDRQGGATPALEQRDAYRWPRISPDGGRLAVEIEPTSGSLAAIWVLDLERQSSVRLREARSLSPVWTPDGESVTFGAAAADGSIGIYRMRADGSGEAELVWERGVPASWTDDGSALAFNSVQTTERGFSGNVWVLSFEGETKARAFAASPADELDIAFSPDGRWLAYSSDESGHFEIYVQPYPGPGRRRVVSTDGGEEPVWSADGRELFYRQGRAMVAVAVETEPEFVFGQPVRLFEGDYERTRGRNYDVHPDGRRFVMIEADEDREELRQLHVVLNWDRELTRLAPPSS